MQEFRQVLQRRAEASKAYSQKDTSTKREPLTLKEIQDKRAEADMDWNSYAMQHADARERYERDFDDLSALAPTMDEQAANLAFEDLMFSKHREYCIGTEMNPGAFYWYARMDYWQEVEAANGVDKWGQDAQLNDVQHWFKVLWREDDPIHHAHEPAMGKSFMMS